MEVITKAMREALGLNKKNKRSDMSIIAEIIEIQGHGSPEDYNFMSTEKLNKQLDKVIKDAEKKMSGGPVKKKKMKGGGKLYRGRSYASGGRVAKYKG